MIDMNNDKCNCNHQPSHCDGDANIDMGVCEKNINMLPMLQTYTTKLLKPNMQCCKNVLTQQMMACENHKYVICWDFDLRGKTITVPKNCILEFDGGSLKNGTIIGQDTLFINVGDVDIWGENLTRLGTWKEHSGGGGGSDTPDKPYDPEHHSGLGRKTLKLGDDGSNILTQEDFDQENTVYIIEYDFKLCNSSVHDIELDDSDKVILQSAERDLIITQDNSAKTVEIDGTTYYYLDIPLAINRTFTLLDTTNCVLLNNATTVSASTTVTANTEGTHVYVASLAEGSYLSAYKISVPYYYKEVPVPANHRIEILDFSKCVFLTDSDGSFVLSYDRSINTEQTDYSVFIASDRIGEYQQVYRITEVTNITIPNNCVLKFEGGSISDGNMLGSNTCIISGNVPIFNNIIIGGTWIVPKIYSEWFGEAGIVDNVIKQAQRLSNPSIFNDIYIKEGDYWVTPNGFPTGNQQLVSPGSSHTAYHLNGNIRVRPFKASSISVFGTYAYNYITIDGGGSVYGDKANHIYDDYNTYPDGRYVTYRRRGETQSDSSHESCHCISIRACHNVTIDSIHCYNATGDGICIYKSPEGSDEENSGKFIVRNCTTYNTRRQGISILASNVIVENCRFEKVYGTAPGAGIDFEPTGGLESKCVLRNCYICDTSLGIEIENMSYRETANVLIENCRVNNATSPLIITKNTAVVTALNSSFVAGEGPGLKPIINGAVLSWIETDYINRISGLNVIAKNCEFLYGDETVSSDKYMITADSAREIKDFRISLENCFIYGINHGGIVADGYSLSMKDCRLYAKNFIGDCTPTSFIENNYMSLNFADFNKACVSGNNIIMKGPIMGGSLVDNNISFTGSTAGYPSILEKYGYDSHNGKRFLFKLMEQTYSTGNNIHVEVDGLDALFYGGADWEQSGAKPNFANNCFASRTNQENYTNLLGIPIAIKDDNQYWFIYFFSNMFNGRKLGDIVVTYEEIFSGGVTSSRESEGKFYHEYSFTTEENKRIKIDVEGGTPDYVAFGFQGFNTLYNYFQGREFLPGASGSIALVWNDGYHLDATLKVSSVHDGQYE